jgi:hypothetical protein
MLALPRPFRRAKAVPVSNQRPTAVAAPQYKLPDGGDELLGLVWARSDDGELAMSTICAAPRLPRGSGSGSRGSKPSRGSS